MKPIYPHRVLRRGVLVALGHARWTSTAHRTASTTLTNSAKKPSPVFLTIRPRYSAIFGLTSSPRWAFSGTRDHDRHRPGRGSPAAGARPRSSRGRAHSVLAVDSAAIRATIAEP